MQNKRSITKYDPSLGRPLTPEDIDYLWDEDTTYHILTIESFSNKVTGGHTTEALERYYRETEYTNGETRRPITIDFVSETDYPGYYIYYIRHSQIKDGAIRTNKMGRVKFSKSIVAKHVIDTNIVPISEYFAEAKEALTGAVPQPSYDSYDITGISKNGIPFKAKIEKESSGWRFLTVYPTLKEKEEELHKGM